MTKRTTNKYDIDKNLLFRFFDNEVSDEEEKMVLDWLDESQENYATFLSERQFFDSVIISGENKPAKRRSETAGLLRRAIPYAACLALIAASFFLIRNSYEHNIYDGMNTVSVASGQHIDIELPDGSKTVVNSLSSIRYSNFSKNKPRVVHLEGEAYFNVSKDENPFIVSTAGCEIEVLGTEFNVESYNGKVCVSLVNGRVKVMDGSNRKNYRIMGANQQLIFENGLFKVGEIPSHEKFQWRDGVMSFRNESFEQLLSKITKYYGVTVEVLNASARPLDKLSGKVHITHGADHTLRVLQNFIDFQYAWDENHDTITVTFK